MTRVVNLLMWAKRAFALFPARHFFARRIIRRKKVAANKNRLTESFVNLFAALAAKF